MSEGVSGCLFVFVCVCVCVCTRKIQALWSSSHSKLHNYFTYPDEDEMVLGPCSAQRKPLALSLHANLSTSKRLPVTKPSSPVKTTSRELKRGQEVSATYKFDNLGRFSKIPNGRNSRLEQP